MKHMLSKEAIGLWQDRLLTTLDRLLELPTTDVNSTLNQVVQLVGEALAAEKVDAFLHNAATDTLMALGTSDTPMGKRQHAIGMACHRHGSVAPNEWRAHRRGLSDRCSLPHWACRTGC
jgi:hypothetical protein